MLIANNWLNFLIRFTAMYHILPELYDLTAERLLEHIDRAEYFSGTVGFDYGDVECRLTASLIVYRRREVLPEGEREPVCDLVPVWWEFHTVADGVERLNDFSFTEIRERLS